MHAHFENSCRPSIDGAIDPDERLHLRGIGLSAYLRNADTVGHQIKVSVGRNKADNSLGVESVKPDALVKANIFKLDSRCRASSLRRGCAVCGTVSFEQNAVVQAELKFRHAG